MNNQHGIRAEDTVEEICYQLFGRDLVLRSPVLVEESGPKELTDVLLIVDDTAIIFQSKSLEVEASELNNAKFGRIQKRHIRAKQQINTALNASVRNAEVRASTPLGVNFTIDWSRIRHKIGVITLSLPDAAYEDPEFRFQFPDAVEQHKGIEVHTFLVNDLSHMALELTTPADVLLYIRTRARCVESDKFIIGNELDLLAFYKIQYPEIEKALRDPAYHIFVTPGYWEGYRKEQSRKIGDRVYRFRNSVLIDDLISRLGTSVEYSAEEYGVSPQESATNYLSLIGKLSKLTRMERALIGDRLIEKMKKTKADKWGYFSYISQLMDIGFIFLVLNEDDREKRRGFLSFLCEQACHVVPCSELVGIATEGAQHKGSSFDAVVMDVQALKSTTKLDPNFTMFQRPVFGKINEWDDN